MNYTSVTNLVWNPARTAVNCLVAFEKIGVVPFAADPNDPEAHGQEIYARCIAGDFGPIADYVPAPDEGPQEPSISPEQAIPVSTPGAIL